MAAEQTRRAEEALDDLFALISDELRAPLTSIVGYVELLLEDADGTAALSNEERRRFLEVVDRNSRRVLRLVGNLLLIARLDAGRLDFERATLDLARPVEDSIEAARPRAGRAGVRFTADFEPGLEVEGDESRIGHAIDNLIANAIKYTPEGGSVKVSLDRRDDEAVITVTDDGVGIPQAEIKQLTTRFFRASTGAGIEGAGLGLAVARAIVEAHGGRIEVSSREGSGSSFAIVLPLKSII